MFQKNLITNLLGIANVFVIKLKIVLYLSKFISLRPKSHRFGLVADKTRNISTTTEYKKFGIYPFKVKKPFYPP